MSTRPAGMHAVIVFAASAATIATAWGFELLGGYAPCPLCLTQRWPYYAVVPLSLALAILARSRGATSVVRAGLALCGVIMIASAGLGAYHSGVEWGFWPGPAACAGGGGFAGGGVLPDLDNARVVACDEAAWRFLGLSFAGWNVVISLVIAAVALRGALVSGHGSSSVSQ